MDTELSSALRQFADRLERGELLADASQCAIVLGNERGAVQASYIGRLVPASHAGIHLMATGIQRMNADTVNAPAAATTTRGSTH